MVDFLNTSMQPIPVGYQWSSSSPAPLILFILFVITCFSAYMVYKDYIECKNNNKLEEFWNYVKVTAVVLSVVIGLMVGYILWLWFSIQ